MPKRGKLFGWKAEVAMALTHITKQDDERWQDIACILLAILITGRQDLLSKVHMVTESMSKEVEETIERMP